MSYLHDRKKNLRKKKLILVLSVFLFIFILSITGLFRSLGGALHKIGFPMWRAENSVSNLNTEYLVRTKKSVFKENENLTIQNKDLQTKMLDYELIKKENEDLKALFGRVGTKDEYILGNIITKPNRSLYDTIVIDIGLNHDLIEGSIVYANMQYPIGKITKVYDTTSLVTLFSSSKEITEAQIEGSNTSIELIGRGGSNFEINVPHELVVPTGTFVVSPLMHSKVVAIVVDIVSDPHDPMNKIILKSPVNVQELKWVQIQK
jgi:cell shape-determining protein MreC